MVAEAACPNGTDDLTALPSGSVPTTSHHSKVVVVVVPVVAEYVADKFIVLVVMVGRPPPLAQTVAWVPPA
jgi:hypothetical protein